MKVYTFRFSSSPILFFNYVFNLSRDILLSHSHQQQVTAAAIVGQTIDGGSGSSTKGGGSCFQNSLENSLQPSLSPCAVQNVKRVEMWVYNLINAPVPIPGKTYNLNYAL